MGPAERMNIIEGLHDDVVELRVSGELDAASAPALAEAIETHDGPTGGRVRLDLDGVTFIDSSGIRVIASAAHHDVAVGAASDVVRRVFEMAGLSALLPEAERP